jgi:hypothetical protein
MMLSSCTCSPHSTRPEGLGAGRFLMSCWPRQTALRQHMWLGGLRWLSCRRLQWAGDVLGRNLVQWTCFGRCMGSRPPRPGTTWWFHRLGPRPDAKVGLTAVAVQRGSGGRPPQLVSVHDLEGAWLLSETRSAGTLMAGSLVDSLYLARWIALLSSWLQLLGAVDMVVGQEQAQACAGGGTGGLITKGCLLQALRSAPKARVPGSGGITYEALQAFCGVLAEPLVF